MNYKIIYDLLMKSNELLDQLIQHLKKVGDPKNEMELNSTYNLKNAYTNEYSELYMRLLAERNGIRKTGSLVTSGIAQLDEITGGFGKELIVLAGRPGTGKTALMLSLIRNQRKEKISIAIYSLELTKEDLLDRLISMETKIPITQLKTGTLTQKELQKIEISLHDSLMSNLYMIETPLFNRDSLAQILRSLVNDKGIQVLYIDYLQLMISSSPRRNREQEISYIMRTLKSLSVEFKIPIILISQLNRNVESRGGTKRPILSDLRESGTIEEIADKVLLLYRPDLVGITLDELGKSTIGKAELIVAKNRLGLLGDIIMSFNDRYGLFDNLSWNTDAFGSLDLPENPFNEPFF